MSLKRKYDLEDDNDNNYSSDESDEEGHDDDENEEEPRIKEVLQDLSKAISQKDASELLHSMASSKDIVFWTPGGEMMRKNRRVPVTNIVELLEYVLLPYDGDVRQPRALNSFLEGLAELRINKRLIHNKKILSDLIEKEKKIQEKEHTSSSENEDESEEEETDQDSDEETQENSQETMDETEQSSEEDEEAAGNDQTKTKHMCDYCKTANVTATGIVGCPKCRWHDVVLGPAIKNSITTCTICQHRFPLTKNSVKNVLLRCHHCQTVGHVHPKSKRETTYPPTGNDED